MKRLAIITTHPIQYYAPFFQCLTDQSNLSVKVFYTWSQSKETVFDREFGLTVQWDIPLLQGYDYTFVENTASKPGTHSFRGIKNPSLIKEIEEWKADAVLVYGWSFQSHFKAICYFHKKIPVLFRGDSTLLDEKDCPPLKNMCRRIFLTWVYRHVDFALYVGEANKRYYAKHGLKENQLFFGPHAIDNERFSANASAFEIEAEKWKAELGIKENACIFLYAAKLIPKKNPELLIQSFIDLGMKDASLLIVGNGELEQELKRKYKSCKGIRFIDFQNQSLMPVVYRLGDVLVLPSQYDETWGLAVNEAMACQRAVVVSDKCGCSLDLVKQGINGAVFESGNKESLLNAMKISFANYKAFGQNSFDIIQNWNYSATLKQIVALLK